MPDFAIRKIAVLSEEIRHDGGPAPASPRRRAAAMALVTNPFACGYSEALQPAMDDLKPLGLSTHSEAHHKGMDFGGAEAKTDALADCFL